MSPICPEAYVVLAMRSSSFEEALRHFRKAEEQGLQVLRPEYASKVGREDDIWGRVALRAWFRWGAVQVQLGPQRLRHMVFCIRMDCTLQQQG
jgi:hypothetical protein